MRRHANDCPVFWKDDKPCNCAMAELAEAERALEKAREFAQWRFNKARDNSEERKRAHELLIIIREVRPR